MRDATVAQREQEIATLVAQFDAQISETAQSAALAFDIPTVPEPTRSFRRSFASRRAVTVAWTLCLGLTVINLELGGLFMAQSKEPAPFELIAGLKTSAAMDAALMTDYLAKEGTLPLSLASVGLPDDDPTLEYQRTTDGHFRIIARHAEYEGVFDSRLEAQREAERAEARAAEARRIAAEQAVRVADSERWLADAAQIQERRRRELEQDRKESWQ